jgi:protein ImuB
MASFLPQAEQTGLSLEDRRRHLVLNLPYWATDCLRRAEPAISGPLALWERQKGAMRLAAVDPVALGKGLRVGQNLSDARAQVPGVDCREIDHDHLQHVFADFADWHSNASPLVGVLTDHAPYGDLCLDITGVTHLFGGEEQMLQKLTDRLRVLGFTVKGAIADTVGAAWALAHFNPGIIASSANLPGLLAELPVAALRLEEVQIAALSQLGLKRVGQLYGRDRKSLQARFGASLVRRIDQALGTVVERIRPHMPVAEHYAERRFAEPIGLIDDVLMCAEDLAVQLGLQLEAKGIGAQSFHLFLYLVDHKVISMSVNASRATRDPGHIARLFKHRAERLAGEYDPGFGIDLIRLGATSLSDVLSTQLGALETRDGTEDLEQLFDRMTSRLGTLAVVRSKYIDTHIPERAVKLEPAVATAPADGDPPELKRPLRLLPHPEPIDVVAEIPDGPPAIMIWRRLRYRLVRSSGPERIEAEWWRSGRRLALAPHAPDDEIRETRDGPVETKPKPYVSKLALFDPDTMVRDYYAAEDETGRRFWIFRQGLYGGVETPSWFMHGFFS